MKDMEESGAVVGLVLTSTLTDLESTLIQTLSVNYTTSNLFTNNLKN